MENAWNSSSSESSVVCGLTQKLLSFIENAFESFCCEDWSRKQFSDFGVYFLVTY